MNLKQQFALLARYNQWMNDKIYHACDQLSDDIREQDKGAFFGSIHRTLDHIVFGDTIWLERLRDGVFTPRKIGMILYPQWHALKDRRLQLDQEIANWTATLDDTLLSQPFEFTSSIDQQKRSGPKWIFIQHMFNHQTHHRGQVTTLLSQLDIDIGSTDIPFMPEFSH